MIIKLSRDYKSIHGLPVISSVDTEIFTMVYPGSSCHDMGCSNVCCIGGGFMDIIAFNKLKDHLDKDPLNKYDWTGYNFENDPYYPGGQGCYTKFDDTEGCFYKNREGMGCVIHSYCLNNKIDFRELKFFACCMFPVEVNKIGDNKNVLCAGYELRFDKYENLPCKKTGDSTVYECSKNDIEYYFGIELIDELEKIRNGKHA
jgi:hypothetical protein